MATSSATAVSQALPKPSHTAEQLLTHLTVGVDDAEVDRYGESLKAMNAAVQASFGGKERIGFRSLVDLFDIKSSAGTAAALERMDMPAIDHFIDTRLTAEAELCRKILMAGCQSDRAAVRARIDEKDPAVLALYRGFSKFMLEDLDMHPATQRMSRSQRRKLSTKVAFEMIMVSPAPPAGCTHRVNATADEIPAAQPSVLEPGRAPLPQPRPPLDPRPQQRRPQVRHPALRRLGRPARRLARSGGRRVVVGRPAAHPDALAQLRRRSGGQPLPLRDKVERRRPGGQGGRLERSLGARGRPRSRRVLCTRVAGWPIDGQQRRGRALVDGDARGR